MLIFIGGAAFQVTSIGYREWGLSLALGFVSIPLGASIRIMPNEPFVKVFTWVGLIENPNELPIIRPASEGWQNAINVVKDNLVTFAALRGGRVHTSSVALIGNPHRTPLPPHIGM